MKSEHLWWLILCTVVAVPAYVVRFKIGWLPLTLLEVLVIGVVAGTVFLAIVNKETRSIYQEKLRQIPLEFWWASFLLLVAGAVAVWVAPDLRAALGIYKAYFIEAFLFGVAVFLNLRTRQQWEEILWAWAGSVLLVGGWAVVQKFTGWGIPNEYWRAVDTRRVTAMLGYPNAVALFVELFIPFGVAFIWWKGWRARASWFFASAVLLSLLAIFYAQSSGAVAAIGGVTVCGLIIWKKTRWWAVAGVVVLGLALLFSPYKKLFGEQFLLQGYSGKLRVQMWGETIEVLRSRSLVGLGLSGYQVGVAPYHVFKWAEIYFYPHNLLLTLWSELGLLGLLSFGWLFGLCWAAAARLQRRPDYWARLWGRTFLAWGGIIFIHGLVDVPYFKNDLAILFWLGVALLWVVSYTKLSDYSHAP